MQALAGSAVVDAGIPALGTGADLVQKIHRPALLHQQLRPADLQVQILFFQFLDALRQILPVGQGQADKLRHLGAHPHIDLLNLGDPGIGGAETALLLGLIGGAAPLQLLPGTGQDLSIIGHGKKPQI